RHLGRFICGSVRSLLDPQIDKSRYPAAVVRLRKYVGAEPGTTPLATLAENEMKAALANPALSPPSRIDVENELQTSKITAEGIEGLFRQFKLEGADQPLALLREQLSAHDRFLRDEVLPKARSDFRLPKPIYAFALERVGVDIPPEELTALAHQAF